MSYVTTSPIELLKERIERATGRPSKFYSGKNYYSNHDPARDDDRPSLLFGETSTGRIWIKDLAGKSTPADVLRALGLDPETLKPESKDFTPARPKANRRRLKIDYNHPDTSYPYTTADGQPVYQVRRFNFTGTDGKPDKTFVQYHWQDGRWQRGRGETPELLYRLPEVVKASSILITEGEKDADNLAALGYTATTHAGGAKATPKALGAYREWLREKSVIILPDNDDPGRAMAEALATGLHGIVADLRIVDPATWGAAKADVSDLIARRRAELLSNEEIKAEIDGILAQGRLWGPQPGPKALERLAQRDKYLAEARAEHEAKEAAKQAQQAEHNRRWEAGNVIPFLGDDVDPDQIEWKRSQFGSAEKWRDYVKAHWPDVDPDLQYQIKLSENREARPAKCGEYRKMTLPNGQTVTRRWTCGVCEQCLKRGVWTYRRALNEIQGIPTSKPGDDLLPDSARPMREVIGEFGALPSYKGRPYVAANGFQMVPPADDDLGEFAQPPESGLSGIPDNAPRENAPPLPQVKGELSLVTIRGDKERLQFARELRTAGVNYKCFPVGLEDGPAYDFLTNDDRGEPLGLAATDDRLLLWVRGVENKRTSGSMLPGLKKLQERYREALPYEIVLPELDDEGQPVDPDIFALELPDIGTNARLPGVVVDFEVNDAESLQAALLEIHREQWRILGRRGAVNYGVMIHKKFYTRYSTLPMLLADFNAWQEALKRKKRR